MNQENFVLVSHKSFFYRLKEAVGKYSALYEKNGNGFAHLHHATQQKRKNRKAKAPPSADGSSSDGNVTTGPRNSSTANAGSDAGGVSGQFQSIINPPEPSVEPSVQNFSTNFLTDNSGLGKVISDSVNLINDGQN